MLKKKTKKKQRKPKKTLGKTKETKKNNPGGLSGWRGEEGGHHPDSLPGFFSFFSGLLLFLIASIKDSEVLGPL